MQSKRRLPASVHDTGLGVASTVAVRDGQRCQRGPWAGHATRACEGAGIGVAEAGLAEAIGSCKESISDCFLDTTTTRP